MPTPPMPDGHLPDGPETVPGAADTEGPRPLLGLREAIALIVGVVVGAGIFKAPALVAGMTGSAPWMFLAWALGGAVSLAGALCYAELCTAHAHPGGDYHFLHRAYGRGPAFLFGWARYTVITTGSIALLAFVFGDYLQQVLPLPAATPALGAAAWAALAVLALAVLNLAGLRGASLAQTGLTLFEVGALLAVAVGAALLAGPALADAVTGTAAGAAALPGSAAVPASAVAVADAAAAAAAAAAGAAATGPPSSFGLAMVFVLLAYGGWNEAAYISAEVRDGRRNMVRVLVLSVILITLLYLLVAWACWHALGMRALAASGAPAADVMRLAFGQAGERVLALLVAVSALTSINATMIVGARTGYALGRDWRALAWLGGWDSARGTPRLALLLQCAAALALVALGSALGGGFRAMVEFTAPVFWLFFLLTGIALFVLRRREPERARPFRVPLYPLLPAVFCIACAGMLWSSLSYVSAQSLGGLNAAWIGVAVLVAGVLVLALLLALQNRPAAHAAPDRRSAAFTGNQTDNHADNHAKENRR
jgi:APA family basic amino acid/polyamine antiporter